MSPRVRAADMNIRVTLIAPALLAAAIMAGAGGPVLAAEPGAASTATSQRIAFPADLRAVIDVKRDCGAKGDGVADDTQALQSAIERVGGKDYTRFIYLAAAVQGSNYCLGANPDNLSYCTGVGYNAQHFNFIVDAHVTGQLPDIMVGHIPYGQGNEGNRMSRSANAWVQQWLLNFGPAKKMTLNWYDWPVNEQYIDFGRYPLHNENCFNQTTVPAACYWFYLHARP